MSLFYQAQILGSEAIEKQYRKQTPFPFTVLTGDWLDRTWEINRYRHVKIGVGWLSSFWLSSKRERNSRSRRCNIHVLWILFWWFIGNGSQQCKNFITLKYEMPKEKYNYSSKIFWGIWNMFGMCMHACLYMCLCLSMCLCFHVMCIPRCVFLLKIDFFFIHYILIILHLHNLTPLSSSLPPLLSRPTFFLSH